MTRTLIKNLAPLPAGTVTVAGWVETVRDQKKVQFVVLRDESGALQLVNPATRELGEDADDAQRSALAITEAISGLAHGTMVRVTGELKHDERVKLGGLEVKIAELEVVSEALPETPIADDSSLDKRLDWRFLDLRRPEAALIFRIQTTFEHALRTYWVDRDFIEIHTPKLMASASESRAELFELEYFEGKAYLSQSPQFFKQMAQPAGFGRVFEIAPAFRADPSFTSRHATEFTSIDAEFSWIDSHEDVMAMHEELLAAAFTAVVEKHGAEIEALFGVELSVPTLPFPRIPLAEAHEIVKAGGYEVPRTDGDLDPEGERRLSAHVKETYGHDFVFVTDYASGIRPFYHMRHEGDAGLTNSYDLLYNGTEISTGAQREHRVEVLIEQAREKGLEPEELEFYLDFFRYGVPPHGGFGMGLARVLMLMLGLGSIRETTYLFRGPTRLLP
ncbi:aspartate--tRNA(Asn) ligase [Microcella daejeonensis]|uniref:aspartate--tRNA(Asn) ligase n=1 Tax=Microcella daejeonensis TaxID=2994971 RepID=UPI00226F7FF8|nr:aspartate--tRNA(Asn) ligase [Microcella daejeonensis]WAB84257.1 aspartate--tRNA(Asn) ligase [Microcella daejeonensis]